MDAYEFFSKYGVFVDVATVRNKRNLHLHEEYEIYYLLTGARDYFIEEEFFVVKTGEFALVPNGCLHKTSGVGGTRFLVYFNSTVLTEIFSEKTAEYLMTVFNFYHRQPQGVDKEVIVGILTEMYSLREKGEDFAVKLKLGELLFKIAESLPVKNDDNSTDMLVKKIVEFTNSNYATIKGVDEVSQKFFLNKSYVCRVFKKSMGIRYTTYLNKVRLKKAIEFLSNQRDNVSTVAEKCGFNSTAYFCKIFKDEYKITPLEFKGGAKHGQSSGIVEDLLY